MSAAFDSNVTLTIRAMFGSGPLDVDWTRQRARLNGVDSYVATPDSAGLSVTGDIDIRVQVALDDWTGAGAQALCTKWGGAGFSWSLSVRDVGDLLFEWTPDNANVEEAISSVRLPTADGDVPVWCRVTLDVDNGASGWTATFYTSNDGSVWFQLGDPQSDTGTTSIYDGTTDVILGARSDGFELVGSLYRAKILNGIDGTAVASPDFTDASQGWVLGDDAGDTGTDAESNVWTLAGSTTILGRGTDLTARCRGWQSKRGRQYELDRVEAGTLSLTADNADGFLNPNNTQSDYYPNVRPMTPIRVESVYDAVTYEVFTGFVESWPPSFPHSGKDEIATPSAVDGFEVLSGQPLRGFWPDVVDADIPIAWWRLADNTDETGNGHTLTYNGTPTEDVAGAWISDLAVQFDGTDDYATVASEAALELLADMSFEAWFKPTLVSVLTVDMFNADDTWTAPANVTTATVECWGAGGGGQAGDSSGQGGGGGGGGAYAKSVLTVVPSTNYTIDVGAAGAAGTGGEGTLGGDGANSSFASTVVVAAGGKGAGVTIPSGTNPEGGAGGQAADSTGTTKRSGGSGGDSGSSSGTPSGGGDPLIGGGGGGGGSGSLSTNGGSGQNGGATTGGTGGTAGGGAGGGGGNEEVNGTAGTAPGGGGGGGGGPSNPSAPIEGDGAAGAAGRVTVTYYAPVEHVLFSCRGASTSIYELLYDGYELKFSPAGSDTTYYSFGDCAPDEWHHAAVTIDWSGSTRIIKGYLDGQLLIDQTSGYQPGAETRAVNIGRRATAADRYFEGVVGELVFYDRVLTAVEVGEHWNANSESLPSQLTSARVQGVLDAIGWASGSTIATGQTTMIAIAASAADTALDVIGEADTTEQGLFFMDPAGLPTFRDRHYRIENHAVSQATFSDDGVNLPYSDIVFSYDNELIKNDITVTDGTNTVQLRNDDSIDKYGRRVASFTVSTSDANELTDTAYFLLAKLAEPALRVDTLVIQPQANVALWPIVLGLDIGDRVTVKKTLDGDDVEADFHIESITHQVTAQKTWQTTWQLSPASTQAFWTLGVANLSELDETAVLAY